MSALTTLSAARNAPAAASVLTRHLVRSSDRVASLPQPWLRSRPYAAAVAALADGDLTAASRHAASAGSTGRLLRRQIDGELALLTRPLETGRPAAYAPANGGGVLHLVTNALPEVQAGYTVRTQGIAGAQAAAGTPVNVVTRLGFPVTKGHVRARQRVEVGGVPHHRLLPIRLPLRADRALARDIDETARLVEAVRPDVLHAHSNHVNAQVALALRARFGIPVVYEARGFLEETWRSRGHSLDADAYQLARARETECLQAADAVVTLSEAMRDAIIERGVPGDRVHVVGNGVDPGFLVPVPLPTGRAFTVGVVGTLNAYEGIDVLIRAIGLLRDDPADTRLIVVGDGPARADLEELTRELGLTDRVVFTGRVPHGAVPSIYRSIDVYAVPRADLPVTRLVPPLKPVEALGLGRPVVASDLPPLREIVGDEQRGLLAAPGDPVALATAIARLRDDADLRHSLGTAGRDWVATERTWAAAARTYDDIYASTRVTTRVTTPGGTR